MVDGAASQRRCSYCQGTDIEFGISVGTANARQPPLVAGLLFAGASLVHDLKGGALEVLRADLCTDCGTVIRLWVDEPDRMWIKSS